MPSRHITLLAITTAILFMASSVQALTAEKRVALVIGNSTYPTAPLANPVNDATDMAALLEKIGFEVILKRDAGKREMDQAVKKFYRRLQSSKGIALFYYAGHGLQMRGQNYLVPVDAEIESEGDVEYNSVNAGWVLSKMEDAANPVNIVILDACRNNPFSRGFRSGERGLAQMPSPTGSIIAYATAPGDVASDGEGRNGLYTKNLLKHLPTPGLSIQDLFTQVGADVYSESGKKQTPWMSSSLMGKISLAKATLTTDSKQPQPVASVPLQAEKQSMEIEKLKLQLEMERLKTEQLRLEAEQRLPERGKTPNKDIEQEKIDSHPPPIAALNPESAVVAPDRSGKPLRVALLAVYGEPDNTDAMYGSATVVQTNNNLANQLVDYFLRNSNFVFALSCLPVDNYRKPDWVRQNVKIISEGMPDREGVQLWQRPSLFSDWEPNKEKTIEKARSFNVDLVLMWRFSVGRGASPMKIYLLDVAGGQLYSSSIMLGSYGRDYNKFSKALEGLLEPYLNHLPKNVEAG